MTKHPRGKSGQFSIIAAIFVSVILVTSTLMTYSLIRYPQSQPPPLILASVEEFNSAIHNILSFTIGYYGSITQVTGNWTYAQNQASRYLHSGLLHLTRTHPEWSPSIEVESASVSTLWFAPESYSMGNLSVTYSLAGLGTGMITQQTSSALRIRMLEPLTIDQARVQVLREGNEPEIRLGKENFQFYAYNYVSQSWELIPAASSPAVYANGTYLIKIPPNVDPEVYLIRVTDQRGIVVTAFYSDQAVLTGIPGYTYRFTWDSSLYSPLNRDTIVVEALQNGTLRWLDNILLHGKPIPPLPVKGLHFSMNSDMSNLGSNEAPFQLEDWGSTYRVPLGLTSNVSLFSGKNMLVFLVNHLTQNVTIWWDGRDTATLTPHAVINRHFNDDPKNGVLDNGILHLNVHNFWVESSVAGGTEDSTAEFLRINEEKPEYGATPAYVIFDGVVRDIVQQEAEYRGGIADTPNVYSQLVLTLPANATYYTYAVRTIFVDSLQARSITDLSAVQLSVTVGIQRTENGTSGGYPIPSDATGLYYNFSTPTGWAHHWSEFVIGTSGAGIMFTNNQQLYIFDDIAGAKTGALKVLSSGRIIEVNPVELSPVSFTYPLDITWKGAVVTFDGEPIYPESDGTVGLWVLVEHPPAVSLG